MGSHAGMEMLASRIPPYRLELKVQASGTRVWDFGLRF